MPYAVRRLYRRIYRQPRTRTRQKLFRRGQRLARYNGQWPQRRHQERCRLAGDRAPRNHGWPLGAPGRVLLL